MAVDPPGPWAEFVDLHLEALTRFAQSQLARGRVPSGRLQAEDVVQHTLAEVFARWQEIQRPERYMFTVARRFVQRAVREGQRFTGAELPADADEAGVGLTSSMSMATERAARPAEFGAYDRIVARGLYAALDRLSGRQRRAVELLHLRGGSREETAAQMEISVGAVSAHRDRGVRKLRVECTSYRGLTWLLVLVAVLASTVVPWVWLRGARAFEAAGDSGPDGSGFSPPLSWEEVDWFSDGGFVLALALIVIAFLWFLWGRIAAVLRGRPNAHNVGELVAQLKMVAPATAAKRLTLLPEAQGREVLEALDDVRLARMLEALFQDRQVGVLRYILRWLPSDRLVAVLKVMDSSVSSDMVAAMRRWEQQAMSSRDYEQPPFIGNLS
ncbi:sigma-70 family RNA polymerase sigma factor [Actinoplanes sp. CA-252034]|uniref:sigma-70 family RNA polymerase sigma factor n=1 Tax=Actinoplanes sp. CA-252034 TaxID=3239906 RepID=UPI003D998554